MEDPFEAIEKLQARLEEAAAAIGLELFQCAFMKDPQGGGGNVVSAVFSINTDAVMTPEEREADSTNAAFAELMGGAQSLEDIAVLEEDDDADPAEAARRRLETAKPVEPEETEEERRARERREQAISGFKDFLDGGDNSWRDR